MCGRDVLDHHLAKAFVNLAGATHVVKLISMYLLRVFQLELMSPIPHMCSSLSLVRPQKIDNSISHSLSTWRSHNAVHRRVQTSPRSCRKLIGDVDENRALDDWYRLPGLSLVPLSIVDGQLRGHLVVPQQRGQAKIGVPRVNHRAGVVDLGLEDQLESRVAGNGGVVGQLRNFKLYGST